MSEGVPTAEDLDMVAALLPEVEHVETRTRERQADGSLTMPSIQEVPALGELRRALDQHGIMLSFDWTSWQDEAQRLSGPAQVATASLDDVRRLFTLHVRKDRFSDGHFAEMVRTGHVAALLRRMAVISSAMRRGETHLRVEQGDITRVAADAIVNAANSALSGGGGRRWGDPPGGWAGASGRALKRCAIGAAKITPAFALPARWVIHAGPVWQGGDAGEAALLASTYRASLELALAHGCMTVAFPAISCGAYRYPVDAACALAVTTIRAWCALHPGLTEVVFVAHEPAVTRALTRAVTSVASGG